MSSAEKIEQEEAEGTEEKLRRLFVALRLLCFLLFNYCVLHCHRAVKK